MFAKTEAFTEAQQEIARFAKLLGHPARVAILQHLAACKTCYSGDIAAELPLSRTTVSQHLTELRNGGLIKGEVSGTNVCYCINPEVFDRMQQILAGFITDTSNGNCC
jgi:DNA-binding transcriptional ArsR family regulator